jgi:hypothetical protein
MESGGETYSVNLAVATVNVETIYCIREYSVDQE